MAAHGSRYCFSRPCCSRSRCSRTSLGASTPRRRPRRRTTLRRPFSTQRNWSRSSRPTASRSSRAHPSIHAPDVTSAQIARVHQDPNDPGVGRRVQLPREARHSHARDMPLLCPAGPRRAPGRLPLHRAVLQRYVRPPCPRPLSVLSGLCLPHTRHPADWTHTLTRAYVSAPRHRKPFSNVDTRSPIPLPLSLVPGGFVPVFLSRVHTHPELRVHFEPGVWKAYEDTAREHPMGPVVGAIVQLYREIGSRTLVMPARYVPHMACAVSRAPRKLSVPPVFCRQFYLRVRLNRT